MPNIIKVGGGSAGQRFYLYKDGDEFTSITGGWSTWTYGGASGIPTLTKNADNMVYSAPTSTYRAGSPNTVNKIDLTKYSVLGIEYMLTTPANKAFGIYSALTKPGDQVAGLTLTNTAVKKIDVLDISSINSQDYIAGYFNTDSGGVTFTIYKVWLM